MQRDINFFSVYRSAGESDHGIDMFTIVGLSLIGACIFGLVGTFAYNKINDFSFKSQQRAINSYLQSGEVKKAEDKWNTYIEKSKALKNYGNKAADEVSAYKTLPTLDSNLLDAVADAMPADVEVKDLAYDGSSLKFTCTASDKLSPANFVQALTNTTKFDLVTYVGVTYVSKIEYDFTVTCMMKGGTAK